MVIQFTYLKYCEVNAPANRVRKALGKWMKRILEVNNTSLDSNLRSHLNLIKSCFALHEKFLLVALY